MVIKVQYSQNEPAWASCLRFSPEDAHLLGMLRTSCALLATYLLVVCADGAHCPHARTYCPDRPAISLTLHLWGSLTGQEVTTLAGSGASGATDGTGAGATFKYPLGVAYSPDGTTALVADTVSHKIRKISMVPPICTRPSDTTGYDSVIENELNTATGFNVTVECAANYEGTASVAACTASGDYSLSGCLRVPDKTSGGLAVSVVIGMIINAMIMTM